MGFDRRNQTGFALRHQLGSWGLTVIGEGGQALRPSSRGLPGAARLTDRSAATTRLGVSLDRSFGSFDAGLGVSWLGETRSILGARLREGLGDGGADSLFLDAELGWRPGASWRLAAAWRQGFTRARATGTIAEGSSFTSSAWALDATRFGLLSPGDSVSLRLSQPLRVENGGLIFSLPVDYSYESLTASTGLRSLSLSPRGRELASELVWRGPLGPGWATASVFYRRNPGHFADIRDDKGAALRWSLEF
jgi:hypothetical protein